MGTFRVCLSVEISLKAPLSNSNWRQLGIDGQLNTQGREGEGTSVNLGALVWNAEKTEIKSIWWKRSLRPSHTVDEREREREKSLTHDNLMVDILIFKPPLFFQALERVEQFYPPHVRVCCPWFSSAEGVNLHRASQGVCCVFNLRTRRDINQPVSPWPDDCRPYGPT